MLDGKYIRPGVRSDGRQTAYATLGQETPRPPQGALILASSFYVLEKERQLAYRASGARLDRDIWRGPSTALAVIL